MGIPKIGRRYEPGACAPECLYTVSPAGRRRLEGAARDRNAAQKHVWRATIILLSADGVGTHGIMRRTGESKTCVWRWQERFMEEGVDGLLRDKTRPSRIPPLGPEVVEPVAALTLTNAPGETTHWTAAMIAAATGVSESATRRIWRSHDLQPHRYRQFKLSNEEFICFLNAINPQVPTDKAVHIILDNYAAASIQRSGPGSKEGTTR